jgi:hypothetical protein
MGESTLIGQYRTAAASFAGRQSSRLVAMDRVTRSTEKMLTDLHNLEQR